MTNRLTSGAIVISVGSMLFLASVVIQSVVTAEEKPKGMESGRSTKIEVDITETERGFNFKGWSLPGTPTTIVLRNHDHVTHGFTSKLFNEVQVKMEGQGEEVKGQKLKSYHVAPGQTLTLHFTSPGSKFDPSGAAETMYYPFWCDIHPEARGELYIVETKGEIGGG